MSLYTHWIKLSSSPLPSESSPRSSLQGHLAIRRYGSQDRDPKRGGTRDGEIDAVVCSRLARRTACDRCGQKASGAEASGRVRLIEVVRSDEGVHPYTAARGEAGW